MSGIICVAPMLDYTDRHFRYLLRLISPRSVLYTEMVTSSAILHGDRRRLLEYAPQEHPLVLQIGGSDPVALSHCARIGEDLGYDAINLNVGCPSARVQEGRFGACLLKEPERVADCVSAMSHSVKTPITVKTRIGVDDYDDEAYLHRFVEQVSKAGCSTWIFHARKAWLKGLSPKENRTIPPLRYDVVYRLKQAFPHLTVILNGGLQTTEQVKQAMQWADGVMIGRHACKHPWFMAELEALCYGDAPRASRMEILMTYLDYIESYANQGFTFIHLGRHLLGFLYGLPKAAVWRRMLSESPTDISLAIRNLKMASSQHLPDLLNC